MRASKAPTAALTEYADMIERHRRGLATIAAALDQFDDTTSVERDALNRALQGLNTAAAKMRGRIWAKENAHA